VALARAGCLYCGAALGELARAEPAASQTPPEPPRAPEEEPRSLVVLDLEGVDPPRLADAFELPAAETAQWVRRGGFRLTTGAASPSEARREVERLAGLGLRAVALAGSRVALARAPYEAQSARFGDGRLHVRHATGSLAIGADDVVLLVEGSIAREYQTPTDRRHFRVATLEQGYLFHLHLARGVQPVELDPGAIEFDDGCGPGSSLLRVRGWIRQLGRDWPLEDGFRFLAPALGLATPPSGPTRLAAALGSGKDAASQVLDNVGQFRFFSAWRGLIERARRSA